tara:strand:+ start:286 stop:654 length:369 start_codon:yes stop_codon:yes gene_type:complete
LSRPSFETKLLLKQVTDHFKANDELQNQLREAFSQNPQPQRERIEQEERNLSDIADGEDLDEGTLSRVESRMVSENTLYNEYDLDLKGGAIVPDTQSYLRKVENNSAIRTFERKVRRSGRYI